MTIVETLCEEAKQRAVVLEMTPAGRESAKILLEFLVCRTARAIGNGLILTEKSEPGEFAKGYNQAVADLKEQRKTIGL